MLVSRLKIVADRIDRLTAAIGRGAAWLCLVIVALQFALVVARYLFGLGSIWLTETVLYAHGALFLLAAAWTLQAGGHVRVDIFYAEMTARTKALVDLFGALLLLLPFCAGADFAVGALCGALLGDPRTLAGGQRPAAGLSAQDADPAVRRAAGAAGRRAGDPRRRRTVSRQAPQGTPMTFPEVLAILLVVAVCAALMAGYPVALTLAGVSLAFAVFGHALGAMNFAILGALPQRIFGVMTNGVLLAIPMFIFMGVMLERSRIAEDLLETMGRLFGRLRGGLAFSVVIVGTLLAAAKGVVGATTVTMGLIVLPAMLRFGYDKRLAAGIVAATATLAQIFPPATVLVLLGDQLGNAYQAAQLAQGNFLAALGQCQRSVCRGAGAGLRAGRALYCSI